MEQQPSHLNKELSIYYLLGQLESTLSRESWDNRTDSERVDAAAALIAAWDAQKGGK